MFVDTICDGQNDRQTDRHTDSYGKHNMPPPLPKMEGDIMKNRLGMTFRFDILQPNW